MSPEQRAAVCGHFDRFARESRTVGLSDQEVTEFLLKLSARWLKAHGVPAANIHVWIEEALLAPAPTPLTAAARERNDFGACR